MASSVRSQSVFEDEDEYKDEDDFFSPRLTRPCTRTRSRPRLLSNDTFDT
jgi:hypothetical protein